MSDIVAKAVLIDKMSPQLQKMSKNTKKYGDSAVALFKAMKEQSEATSRAMEGANARISRSILKLNKDFDAEQAKINSVNNSLKELGLVSSSVESKGISQLRQGLNSLGVVLGLGGLAKSFFNATTQIEDLEVQFETLLGGVDEAKSRVKELSDFASKTPFQLEEVGKASKTLETLTKGALSTGEGLRLVGDASAIAGESFENLAVHIGRAYDGLQSNRPIGEAMARLQELGLVSGETRGKIEDLQKQSKGKEAWKILRAELEKTKGGMEKLSQTTTGIVSTIKDRWKQLLRNLNDGSFMKTPLERMSLFLDTTNQALEHMELMNELAEKEKSGEVKQLIANVQKLTLIEQLGGKISKNNAAAREEAYKRILLLTKELGMSEERVSKITQESRLRQLKTMKSQSGWTEETIKGIDALIERTEKELVANNKILSLKEKINKENKKASSVTGGETKKESIKVEWDGDDGFQEVLDKDKQVLEHSQAWAKSLEENRKKRVAENERTAQEQKALEDRRLSVEEANLKARQDAEDKQTEIFRKGKEDRIKLAEQEAEARYNLALTLSSSLSTIARNALGTNKKNANIRKGIAYSEAVINTALGVSKALASAPPPINFINAAAVGAAGAAQISTIATQKFATGGIVKGNGGSDLGDKQMIRVNAGEGVFTKEQMKALGKTEINIPITINGNADQGVVDQFSEIAQSIIGAIRNGDLDLINELNLQTA